MSARTCPDWPELMELDPDLRTMIAHEPDFERLRGTPDFDRLVVDPAALK